MDTLDSFDERFQTDDDCKRFLVAKRWPDGKVRCPRCNRSERVYALKARAFHWACKNADCGGKNGYRFSVLTHTIFSDTKVPLKIWFKIGYLMVTAKKGMSSLQVRRVMFGEDSGTDWRTCWFICHRWRCAMKGDAFPLTGIVEIDESHVGGEDRNRHWGKKSRQVRERLGERSPGLAGKTGEAYGYGKTEVIGAIARKGMVVARVVGTQDAPTLQHFVRNTVSDKVSLVATDENPAYNYVRAGMPHKTVRHGRGEYVRGEVHTNNIESFWSLIKRGVMGSYHHVSKDYLPLYLNEFSWRFNNRNNPNAFDDLVATCSQ